MGRLEQLIEDAVAALTALDSYALEKIRSEIQGLPAARLSLRKCRDRSFTSSAGSFVAGDSAQLEAVSCQPT